MSERAIAAQDIPAGKRDPEARQRRLLQAATEEFAARGLEGARVDEIARQAGVNKQLVYHYFGNKDGLYLEVLEQAYQRMILAKMSLNLKGLAPYQELEKLVAFTYDYYRGHREFVSLLNDENVHRARHIRQSRTLLPKYVEMMEMLGSVLRRGGEDGSLRPGIDPVQFYITLSGMCYFYFGNMHTLSVIFDRDLSTEEALAIRRQHVIDTVMNSVRP